MTTVKGKTFIEIGTVAVSVCTETNELLLSCEGDKLYILDLSEKPIGNVSELNKLVNTLLGLKYKRHFGEDFQPINS